MAGIDGRADPEGDFISCGDPLKEALSGQPLRLAEGEACGDDGGSGVIGGVFRAVVQLEGMGGHAVHQRRRQGRTAEGAACHYGSFLFLHPLGEAPPRLAAQGQPAPRKHCSGGIEKAPLPLGDDLFGKGFKREVRGKMSELFSEGRHVFFSTRHSSQGISSEKRGAYCWQPYTSVSPGPPLGDFRSIFPLIPIPGSKNMKS